MTKKLAIRGHATRGNEVIQLLEMMGGMNNKCLHGVTTGLYYFIDYKEICSCESVPDTYVIFTLEEFLEKFPYKVGDEVITIYGKIGIVEKLDWSDKYNAVRYELDDDEENLYFANELQPYKEETMEEKLEQIILEIPVGYEFFGINDDNKVVLTKKQLKHPQTYEECCELLGKTKAYQSVSGYKTELLEDLQKLLICRDAYWKIAGEQMGLGKPWEPVWSTEYENKYVIEVYRNNVRTNSQGYSNTLLAFPTIEMRDAFYENFKNEIEQCKELL